MGSNPVAGAADSLPPSFPPLPFLLFFWDQHDKFFLYFCFWYFFSRFIEWFEAGLNLDVFYLILPTQYECRQRRTVPRWTVHFESGADKRRCWLKNGLHQNRLLSIFFWCNQNVSIFFFNVFLIFLLPLLTKKTPETPQPTTFSYDSNHGLLNTDLDYLRTNTNIFHGGGALRPAAAAWASGDPLTEGTRNHRTNFRNALSRKTHDTFYTNDFHLTIPTPKAKGTK